MQVVVSASNNPLRNLWLCAMTSDWCFMPKLCGLSKLQPSPKELWAHYFADFSNRDTWCALLATSTDDIIWMVTVGLGLIPIGLYRFASEEYQEWEGRGSEKCPPASHGRPFCRRRLRSVGPCYSCPVFSIHGIYRSQHIPSLPLNSSWSLWDRQNL